MIASGVTSLFGYQVIRQLQQIGAFYAIPKHIDLFNLRPLYGFSRYTAALGIMFFASVALTTLDPTAYESQVVLIVSFALIPLILLMFYLPLSGVHRRLVSEKERLLQEANSRIETILERIHLAAFEQQDYEDVGGMRTVFSTLREEKETVQGLSTWPWRPGTLTGLLSALFLPIILVLVREIISMFLSR
jgi:ABC-type multidrug transport system fused ATPase/permease subunit